MNRSTLLRGAIVGPKAVDAHRAALKGARLGKGCVRYADPAKIDFNTVKPLLASAAGCD